MKFLENLMHKLEQPFTKGKKLEKFHPVFDGFYTFLFTPKLTTTKGAHIRDGVDLKRTMFMVIVAMVPCLLFGMWNVGHWHYTAIGQADATLLDKFIYGLIKVLPLIIVSYAVGLGIEFVFCIIKGHSINEGYLVSGMLIPLVLPPDTPLWMVALACIFAVVIGKEVFGGTGMNILNVALTARAFLFFAYPNSLSGEVWISGDKTQFVDGYTGATALGYAADKTSSIDVFTTKYSLMDSFFGFIPGSIGETSTLACLIGAAILLFTGVASWRIIFSVFLGGYVMGLIFNAFGANTLMQIDALHHLVIGGFAFGAVFMATDPVTAAQTSNGKFIYGFFIGFFAILIRVFNPAYPEGMMMAILFMNVMAPLIDHYVVQSNINKRMKRLKLKNA
jgi:Na+-transporting NADH:ubiquinone oxidoreductase subunit B